MNLKITGLTVEPLAGEDRDKYFSNVQCLTNGLIQNGVITVFVYGEKHTLLISHPEQFRAKAHFNNDEYVINTREVTQLPRRGSFLDLWIFLKRWWFFRRNIC